MKRVQRILTSSQFKSLNAIPVMLLPSSGPRRAYLPITIAAQVINGTVAYTGGSTLGVGPNALPDGEVLISSHAELGDVGSIILGAESDGYAMPVTSVANKPMYLNARGGEYADGDGDVLVTVWYVKVPVVTS